MGKGLKAAQPLHFPLGCYVSREAFALAIGARILYLPRSSFNVPACSVCYLLLSCSVCYQVGTSSLVQFVIFCYLIWKLISKVKSFHRYITSSKYYLL